MRCILFILLCVSFVHADGPVSDDEVRKVDYLIEATGKKLEQQKELQRLMVLFQEQEERFFQGDQSKEHALRMVRTAHQILGHIKKAHLEYLFSSEYLEQLAVFSSIAGRRSPVRP